MSVITIVNNSEKKSDPCIILHVIPFISFIELLLLLWYDRAVIHTSKYGARTPMCLIYTVVQHPCFTIK